MTTELEPETGAMTALRSERALRKRIEKALKQSAAEASQLHMQLVKLSAENRRLAQERDRLTLEVAGHRNKSTSMNGALERRDQTIAGLRQALANRKDQIHV